VHHGFGTSGGGGHDFVARNVVEVLRDVPAVPERVFDLAVPVAPEHVRQGLTHLGAGRDRLREHRIRVGHSESEHDRCAADRRRGEHAHFGELISDVQHAVADAQLHGHQPPVGRRDPFDLLRAERVAVEAGSALGDLNNDVWSDGHPTTVGPRGRRVLNVVAVCTLGGMPIEQVRMWRPADEERVLLMAGRTTSYTMEPRGEYVFGIVAGAPMGSRRGRERRLVRPGQLVAWDPSSAHSGTTVSGQPWTSRLMVLEVADLDALATDAETDSLVDVAFPDPVLSDPELAAGFLV
jgi:hypothetical protein